MMPKFRDKIDFKTRPPSKGSVGIRLKKPIARFSAVKKLYFSALKKGLNTKRIATAKKLKKGPAKETASSFFEL